MDISKQSHKISINPLSATKGQKYLCEICGQPGVLACSICHVTYYCSSHHSNIDYIGIHEKICSLLLPLRTLTPIVSSEDDRLRRNLTIKMSQHALIDLCKNEASKFLVSGKYELAIPGALQSLRFSMEVYGDGRIELVPCYLLLAEANLGICKFKLAEEFLTLANWNVLKNPNCSNVIKSQLYRLFGKLYASQGNYADALLQLAHDIYFSSIEVGPEHIDTAGGYYYIASVFLLQERIEHALANFDKVVDIWYKFLLNLRSHPQEKISDYLGEAQIGEATEMLKKILETRSKYLSPSHIATGEAAYALGILMHISQNDDAKIFYGQAYSIYHEQLGPDHESSKDIITALESLGLDDPFRNIKTGYSLGDPTEPATRIFPPDSADPMRRSVEGGEFFQITADETAPVADEVVVINDSEIVVSSTTEIVKEAEPEVENVLPVTELLRGNSRQGSRVEENTLSSSRPASRASASR